MDEQMNRDCTNIDDGPEGAAAQAQARVRDALRGLDVAAPDTLRLAVEREVAAAGERDAARSGWRLPIVLRRDREIRDGASRTGSRRLGARPLALAAGALAALALVLVFALSGPGGAGPTVQEASRVALLPASAPAPATRPGGDMLDASVDGIAYPTWTRVGWHVVGERSDTLAGHRVHTVLYADGQGGRVGYAIAAGDALPVEGGRIVVLRGAQLRLLAVGGATVVTWRRDGHTCILASRGVAPERLLTLASYAT